MSLFARAPFPVDDLFASSAWPGATTEDIFSNFAYQQQHQVRETEHAVELSLDVPGVKAQDLNVEITEGGTALRVSGERKTAGREFKFDRSFRMDHSMVDSSAGVKANLEAGVLTLTMAKRPKVAPQKIVITQESAKQEQTMAIDNPTKGSP